MARTKQTALAAIDDTTAIADFFKKKTLGVPRWGWLTALACVGLFHISK